MNKGDVIDGYKIITDVTMAGGGTCTWAFAKKGTKTMFIKEFLSPVYPLPESPGNPEKKQQRLEQCIKFEEFNLRFMNKVNANSLELSNLIVAKDFFRYKTKYYKVTEVVDVNGIEWDRIISLDVYRKTLLFVTSAYSISQLHSIGVVHSDLKPDNLLIKSTINKHRGYTLYTSKLIDFDSSFFEDSIPETLVGDMAYYSPEQLLYVKGNKETLVTTKSDIFSLALIFVKVLTNDLSCLYSISATGTKYHYCCEASLDNHKLELPIGFCPEKLRQLINNMLSWDANSRPTSVEVHNALKELLSLDETYAWEIILKKKLEQSSSRYKYLMSELFASNEKSISLPKRTFQEIKNNPVVEPLNGGSSGALPTENIFTKSRLKINMKQL